MKCKRLWCFGMAAMLVCTGLPGVTVLAQEIQVQESVEAVGETEEDFQYYENEDGTLTITQYVGDGTEIEIPSEINGKNVTAIRDLGISDSWVSVTIPESVTSINEPVFPFCNGLIDINVAEANKTYASEDGVLYNKEKTKLIRCPRKKEGSVSIPGSVTSIAGSAFAYCGLTDITIPEGVTSIGSGTFQYCSLTSIAIPKSVTSIGQYAFYTYNKLKDVYYAGSEEEWKKISIGRDNDVLLSAAIHYNSSGTGETGGTGGTGETGSNGGTGAGMSQKKLQSVTAKDVTKTYGEKPFSLGASALGGALLSYASSNAKVASVAQDGTVTINGCGVAVITITAKENTDYKAASKTVILTVKPKKALIVSVKSKKKKMVLVKWKRDKAASGYLVECATDKKFKKNKVQLTVDKNKTVSATVKKLKGGKKYYFRVCAYVKDGTKKIQGDFSKPKTVKVKK